MFRLQPAGNLAEYDSPSDVPLEGQEQLLYTLRRWEANSLRQVEFAGLQFISIEFVAEVYRQITGGECSCQTSLRKLQQKW